MMSIHYDLIDIMPTLEKGLGSFIVMLPAEPISLDLCKEFLNFNSKETEGKRAGSMKEQHMENKDLLG